MIHHRFVSLDCMIMQMSIVSFLTHRANFGLKINILAKPVILGGQPHTVGVTDVSCSDIREG